MDNSSRVAETSPKPLAATKPRLPHGKIQGRKVAGANRLVTVPVSVQHTMMAWLTFEDRSRMSCVNRQCYYVVGTHPVYVAILKASGLPIFPISTPASQVVAAINQENYKCMSYMAEAIQRVERRGPFYREMKVLWRRSTKDALTADFWNLYERYLTSVSDRHLLGYALDVPDSHLWNILEGKVRTVEQKMDLLSRGVWGFCDPLLLNRMHLDAKEQCEAEGLSALDRKKFAVLGDLLYGSFSRTTEINCDIHLGSPEGVMALSALKLLGFAQLISAQGRLADDDCPNIETIAGDLLKLYNDASQTPHLRALAGLSLASLAVDKRTSLLDESKVFNLLCSIKEQECLRENVRHQAEMLLGSLQARGDVIGTRQELFDLVVLAKKTLRHLRVYPRLPGFVIHEFVWAKDTLVRLDVSHIVPEAISKAIALSFAVELSKEKSCSRRQRDFHASLIPILRKNAEYPAPSIFRDNDETEMIYKMERAVFERYPVGSLPRIEAALTISEIYLYHVRKRWSYNDRYSASLIESLREILSVAQYRKHRNYAKLLLAQIRVETKLSYISDEEAMSYCRQVYYSTESSKIMRHMALEAMVHLD